MAAVTLEQLKVGMVNDLDRNVIDEFIKGDYLMQTIPFDFIANPVKGGAGWIATYVKVKSESKTGFRNLYGVYEDTVATRDVHSAEVKIFGGSIKIDRALRDQGAIENEVSFQVSQLLKSTRKTFSYYLINGSKTTNANQFDGLDTLLKGSATDVNAKGTGIDLSTFEKMKANGLEFITVLDDFLGILDEKPDVLLGNSRLINKIKAVCKIVGINTMGQDELGRQIDQYDGIRLVKLGTVNYDGTGAKETIPIDNSTKETALYAVKFGEDAFILASPESGKALDVLLPDFTQASEQVRGLVEFRAVPMLKHSKKCGVLRKIKVGE